MPITPIQGYPGFIEVIEDTPIIKTVPIAATQLFSGVATKWAAGYLIRLRSVGTSTYVRIGNSTAQEYTLKAAGDFKAFSAPEGMLVDMTQVYTKSDTADAVIEVVVHFVPVRMDGNVKAAYDYGVTT
jgi:hypothetical protein